MNIIDLFAGCGGLTEGFRQNGFRSIAFIEWNKHCINTLKANHIEGYNFKPIFYEADIRDFNSYLTGFDASLEHYIKDNNIDGIIGGPPCQAYSLAGRIRDPNGMRYDYRNYLFEAYAEVLRKLNPRFFVFENVSGILSAKPGGISVVDIVKTTFEKLGYIVPEISKKIIYDLKKMGGPQNRKRVFIYGVNKKIENNAEKKVKRFYDFLDDINENPKTVYDAIGDLPKILPLKQPQKKISHYIKNKVQVDQLHIPRFHNFRDIEIFKELAMDIDRKVPKYNTIQSLKELYNKKVGKTAKVHKYYVLKRNSQSNLIPAHIYKDGLRHIHYDSDQARSITIREAARLQTFSDSYKFIGPNGELYKMIGNAVPPLMSCKIALAVRHSLQY